MRRSSNLDVKALRSAVLIGLACCVATTGALARPSSQSKSARSEKTTKKHRTSASAKSKKSKARKQVTRGKRTSESGRFTTSYRDLPPEDLPEEEIESDANELR